MLYDKLIEYAASGVYPMHMPGHKRNPSFDPGGFPLSIDITEVNGFDDLCDPQGVLLETSRLAAKLYGSIDAFLLLNGSTVGVLAAIGAHTSRGDKILVDRNCHRSVIGAARLFGLDYLYVSGDVDERSGVVGSVEPEHVRSVLQSDNSISLVVVTSPSYEGVVSDIASISDIVHEAGALLFVDSAHGAHLGFSPGFPKNPVTLGADVVVVSLHKTLPALTQCSLLHICTDRVALDALREILSILQTSSPSYVLMASIDRCLRLLETDAEGLFREYEGNLEYFAQLVSGLGRLRMLDGGAHFFDLDPGKIVIVTKDSPMTGTELQSVLRGKYKIQLEKAFYDYTIAMTSVCDTREGFSRLAEALLEVDMC